MLTFQKIYEEVQEQVQDSDATSLVLIKRAINQGAKRFGSVLSREWRTSESTFSLVANQQFYQMPEIALMLRWVTVTVGGVTYRLREIADEDTWQDLNMRVETSTIPEFFYIRGNDEFGIWPIPSANVSNGGRISYERRMRDMTVADYTTGTVTLTNNDASVTGAGTSFTAAMVGRWLNATSEDTDGQWYKIATRSSATAITLENTYAGNTVAGLSYVIGEVPDIPEEFHESLIDYACWRYYKRRRDIGLSRDMKSAFDEALAECMAKYSSKSGSQYFRPLKLRSGYTHHYRDYEVT